MKNTQSKLFPCFVLLLLLLSFNSLKAIEQEQLEHANEEEVAIAEKQLASDFSTTKDVIVNDTTALIIKAYQYLAISDSLSNIGQHPLSIEAASEAMVIFKSLGDWSNYLSAKGFLTRNYSQMGEFARVAQLNEEMKKMIEEKKLPEAFYIQVHFLSGTLHHEKGWYAEAVQDFEAVLDLLNDDNPLKRDFGVEGQDSLVMQAKNWGLASTYNYAAFSIVALGNFEKGLDYFKKARHYYELSGDQGSIFNAAINIGSAYKNKGAVDEAIPYFNTIIEQLEGIPAGIPIMAIAYSNLIDSYGIKKDYVTEKEYIEELKKLFEKPEIALLQTMTGVSLEVAHASVLSREILNQAHRGAYESVAISAKNMLSAIEGINTNVDHLSGVYHRVGTAFFLSGQMEKALECYQKGLALLVPDLNEADYFENPSADKLLHKLQGVELLSAKAKAMFMASEYASPTEQLHYLETALATAERSATVFESIQRNLMQAALDQVSREGSLLDLEKHFEELYDLNIDIVFALYQKTKNEEYMEKAFQVSEKNKAYILRRALDKVERLEHFPTEKRKALQDLEAELFFFDKEIIKADRANMHEKKERLELQQINLKEKYQQLITELKNNPETAQYYMDQYEPRVVSITEIQRLLAKENEKAILQFYEGKDKVYSFFITATGCKMQCKMKPRNWENQIDRLRKLNLDLNLIVDEDLIEEYLIINEEIATLLFPLAWSKNNDDINRLVVIPDGKTLDVNFNLLLRSFESPVFHDIGNPYYTVADCSSFDYLSKKYAVAYAHSAAILLDDAEKVKRINRFDFALLGVAPDYTNRNILREQKGLLPLGILPNELNSVLDLFDPNSVKILNGEQANKAAFRSFVSAHSSNILHVSAHGEIDEENVMLSRIQLAANLKDDKDNKDRSDDDLEIGESYSMKINTELAILSVCSSGHGERIGSSAKISLARGFAYANCPGIIMGLWDLETGANQEIIEELYVQLITHKETVDRSLQQAQLNYLDQRQLAWSTAAGKTTKEKEQLLESMHPFFWAGLVPIGRTNRLSIGGEIGATELFSE